jgi:hypothetical protein
VRLHRLSGCAKDIIAERAIAAHKETIVNEHFMIGLLIFAKVMVGAARALCCLLRYDGDGTEGANVQKLGLRRFAAFRCPIGYRYLRSDGDGRCSACRLVST